METKKYVVAIVGKEIFHNRMHIEQEFGEVLYDQIIFVLENIGIENAKGAFPDERIGFYLDSQNPGSRKFELTEDKYWGFIENFSHRYFGRLEKYSKREQKKGTDVLFQLNEGNISMKDFEKRI